MDKENTYSLLLLLGLIVGAGMAAISIVEESNLTNYEWAAKIEETTNSMEKYLTQLEGLSKDKRSPITEQDKAYVGVPAPILNPIDEWFSAPYGCPPVVTEKQKAYQESESFKEEAIKYYSKEPDNIHQLMYEKAEKLNGRTAMVGFFFAVFSYALTGNLFFGML